MKHLFFALAALVAAASPASAQSTAWSVDKSHSKLGFSVTHLVISEVDGHFGDYTVAVKSDKADFSDARVDVIVKTTSVDTDEPKRDEHLRSEDFFSSAKFPDMTFKGKQMRKTGDTSYKLDGELTIRDVTKPVTLDVTFVGTAKDPWGNMKAGFKLSGKINRSAFGLTWNKALEAGGWLVSEDVTIEGSFQLARSAG
jgi:polyisoprenoid-binding protein YceI